MYSMLLSAVRASADEPKAVNFITTGVVPSLMIRRFRLGQLANSSLMGLFHPG